MAFGFHPLFSYSRGSDFCHGPIFPMAIQHLIQGRQCLHHGCYCSGKQMLALIKSKPWVKDFVMSTLQKSFCYSSMKHQLLYNFLVMKLQEIELRNKTFVAMVCSIIARDFLALLPYVSGIAILGNTYLLCIKYFGVLSGESAG